MDKYNKNPSNQAIKTLVNKVFLEEKFLLYLDSNLMLDLNKSFTDSN